MEKAQRARCSGRGRGGQGGLQRNSLSPTSPNRCTMQLRDPSSRKTSSLRSDAFEWSPNSKGNRRNCTSKKLVIHLERIPESTYKDYCPSEPPKLQHYLQDVEETVGADQSDCDNTSAPPNLVPEVIVSRDEKQKQGRISQKFSPGESSCEPSSFNKLSGSQAKVKDNIESPTVLPKLPQNKSDQKSCDLGNQNTKLLNESFKDDNNVDMVVKSEHPNLYTDVPREFAGKRNDSTSPSPCLKDEDDVESIGGWSDLSETLFQEPERISTGKEQVENVEGVDILTFETEKDLFEFTAIEMDHIYGPPPISCDELSAIVTTKTNDITKIKGWRTKFFAGKNNYSSDYESCVIDVDDLGKESASGSVSPVPCNASCSFTDIKREREDSSLKKSTLQGSPAETRKSLKEGKIHKSTSASKLVAKGIGSPSNLDETWVEFAVSALVLPAAMDSTKEHQSSEDGERSRSTAARKKKKTSLILCNDESEKQNKLGRPPLFPLSPYMKKKIKLLKESFMKQSKKSSKKSNMKLVTFTNNIDRHDYKGSVQSNSTIVPASDINKMKVNKELKKLGHVVIDIDENRRKYAASTSQDPSKQCTNEFCKLGCVCNSLATLPQPQGHCGKVECMFECTCTKTLPNLAVEKLIENENRDLAPEEKEFRHAVITGGDGVVMVKQRGRREIKIPGRFRDENMLTGDALVAVIDNKRKSPAKPKPVKETQSVPTYGKPLVKKSILQNCPNSQQYSQATKLGSSRSNLQDHLGEYFNIPSPERLEEPCSTTMQNAKMEMAPLFNTEGGFISVHKEEAFMAHHRKIKQEKPSTFELDANIEIDEMGWHSLDAENDKIPFNSERKEDHEFGKIVSITSLAPEEFDKTISDDAATSALEEKILEQVHMKPKKPLVPGISSKQRGLAKVRAKNLVEFFISNASVSALVKSAYEFKPSVVEREAITLLQWTSLKNRFQENKIHIWVTDRRQDFHFIATESEEDSILGYVNLRTANPEEMSIPLVARELLQPHIVPSDSHKCCIFWCNGIHWEFIGCLQKNKSGLDTSKVTPYNGKYKTLRDFISTTTLPCNTVDAKWYSIPLSNDFEALELRHENTYFGYAKLNQLKSISWKFQLTEYFEINKAIQHIHPMHANFGLYAIPDEALVVYLGPYDVTEHPLLELIPFEGSVCKARITSIVIPAAVESEFLCEIQTTAVIINCPTKIKTEVRTRKPDNIYGNMPLVTSKGRTRKIPRHLWDEDDNALPAPPRKRPKKAVYKVESIEIPVLMPTKISRKNEKTGRERSTSKDETENSLDNITSEFDDDLDNEFMLSSEENSRLEIDLDQNSTQEKSKPESRKNSGSEESSEDEGEKSESEDENEDEDTQSLEQRNKKRRVSKTGSFAKLECTLEAIEDVPIVLYDNGCIRFRNPYGIKVVHLENFAVAKRFLNYLFKDKFPDENFNWFLTLWTEQTPELDEYFKKLQAQRVRKVTKKELDRTIGYEGRVKNRPIRHKFKPWKRKVVRKNAVVRVLEECEQKGMETQLGLSAWKRVKKTEIPKPVKPSQVEAPKVVKVQQNDMIDCSSPSTMNEDEDGWFDDNNQWRSGDQRLLHRDMEKVRRRELALCFRTLASMLVPPDMLERCSKIMVLQKGIVEIKTLTEMDKLKLEEKAQLETKRDQLYKKFSQVIEGLGPSEKAHQVHQLKELLDALKNSVPRQNWSSSKPDSNFSLLDQPLIRPPPQIVPSTSNQDSTPQPVKKAIKRRRVVKKKNTGKPAPLLPGVARSLPPGVRMTEPMLHTDMLPSQSLEEEAPPCEMHIDASPVEEAVARQDVIVLDEPGLNNQDSLSSESLADRQREQLPTLEPGSSNSEDLIADFPAEPAIVIREPGQLRDISRSKNLPSHVRITKDALINFPRPRNGSSLISRKLADRKKTKDHKLYKYVGGKKSDVVLSDEEGGPSKMFKLSYSATKKENEESIISKDLEKSSCPKEDTETFEVTITKVQKKPQSEDSDSNSRDGNSKLYSLLSEKSTNPEPDISITKTNVVKPKNLECDPHSMPGVSYSISTTPSTAPKPSFSLSMKPTSNHHPLSKPMVPKPIANPLGNTVRMTPALSKSSQNNSSTISMPNPHTTIRRPNSNVSISSPSPAAVLKSTINNKTKPHNPPTATHPSSPANASTSTTPKFTLNTTSSTGAKLPVHIPTSSIVGPVPIPKDSQPLVMTQNGKRYLIMPGGKKNEDPKLVAKYAALADKQQHIVKPAVVAPPEKKTSVNAPKFRINKELMRARLNAVKPRNTQSTNSKESDKDAPSTKESATLESITISSLLAPITIDVSNNTGSNEDSKKNTKSFTLSKITTNDSPKTSTTVPENSVPEVIPSNLKANNDNTESSSTTVNTSSTKFMIDNSSKTDATRNDIVEKPLQCDLDAK